MSVNVSLIITTYNWVPALKLVLDSALAQTRLPDEIIIADDGSTSETADLIRGFKDNHTIPIIHAWQEDDGFRLAKSRNNGVRHSTGDYLIFIDGDTILHDHFIADHLALAETNVFSVGSRVLLQENETEKYLSDGVCDFAWLASQAHNKLNGLHSLWLANVIGKKRSVPVETLIFKVRGCNMAVWRQDYLAINGFNEGFADWGREDSEFALRLFKKGLAMKRIKFAAIQYHLYHVENDRSQLLHNDDILARSLAADSYRCEQGYDNDSTTG